MVITYILNIKKLTRKDRQHTEIEQKQKLMLLSIHLIDFTYMHDARARTCTHTHVEATNL